MLRLRNLPDLQRKPDVIIDIHVGIKTVALEHHRHIAVLGLQIIDPALTDINVALGAFLKTCDHPHGCGLPTPRRPQENQKFLIGNIKIEIVHTDKIAPSLRHVFKPDLGHATPLANN